MDPKLPAGMLLAPAASGGAAAARLPGRDSYPSPDEHLVTPEVTRDEMIRGRRVIAMPANPRHADRQFELGFVIRGHLKPGYVGSTELLTRMGLGSDFATDICVRKDGKDPETDVRHLEELAFEVVNEQSARDIREKAEDLTARGVRCFIAVFVKTGQVCRWSREKGNWQALDLDGVFEDPCLSRPLRLRALLDAAEADDAVARALVEKQNPVIEAVKNEGKQQGIALGTQQGIALGTQQGIALGTQQGIALGKATAILAVLAARGLPVSEEARARIADCRDDAVLDRWIGRAAVAGSAQEVLASEE
jgi:flagellar biosynthesis/type III secretory pathway protein FliH